MKDFIGCDARIAPSSTLKSAPKSPPLRPRNFKERALILESFQAGLSWECVLNKRQALRRAFSEFDRDSIMAYDEAKIEELMATPGIIRNRAKIKAAISNTAVFKEIQAQYGSFDGYLRGFCPEHPIADHTSTTSSISDALSADLRKRGMKFVGSTTIHAFLQSIGVINAHHPDCFLRP